MRHLLFLLFAFATICTAKADEIVVNDITIHQGGEATLNIELNNTGEYTFFSMDLVLPDGITVAGQELGERFAGTDHRVQFGTWPSWYRFMGLTDNAMIIPGNSGTLISITLQTNEVLTEGDTFQATLTGYNQDTAEEIGIEFSTPNNESVLLGRVTFTITIGEPLDTRTILDEASTIAPESATGVDVRVKRTIKADEWSTICLPFAMTEAQVKEAFGEDVQLADFTGYEVEEDEEGNVAGLSVNFSDVDAIEANHPYLIKVSAAVSEFTVDGVDIAPEEDPTVATVKRTRKQWSEFIGTYTANTAVPEKTLFLSGNKFYYSTGATKMKAFRGYFDFYDVLTEVDESYAKVRFFIDETAAEIEGIGGVMQTGAVYSVSGVRMGTADRLKTLPRGLYIVNGKKVYNQ